MLRNKLVGLEGKAETGNDKVLFWETLVKKIKLFIAEKSLEHEMVIVLFCISWKMRTLHNRTSVLLCEDPKD